MFKYEDHILGIQGHPEFTIDILFHFIDRLTRRNLIQVCRHVYSDLVILISIFRVKTTLILFIFFTNNMILLLYLLINLRVKIFCNILKSVEDFILGRGSEFEFTFKYMQCNASQYIGIKYTTHFIYFLLL
jgi:cellulose synthase/poly-beta-1,6-N-acetylglucosamine synthase-like glycosyltransferase